MISALVLRDTQTQPLVPTVGSPQPRVTRRCDGTIAMAYYVAQTGTGGDIVVTRYKANQALDPSFRAASPSATPPTFLLRAPDESLLMGTASAKGTSIRRVVP